MITLYTKDYCAYCVMAKNLLSSLGVTFEEIDLTGNQEGFMRIYEKSHMRTLPQIFVEEVCLGGYDDIRALHTKGKLLGKL